MRTLKKALCIVLALVMAVGLLTVAAGAKSLSDYSDANKVSEQYKTAVDVNTQLGVLKGMTETAYEPQGTLNRAQLATIIYRIVTGDVKDEYVANYAKAERFADVPSDAWFAGYVNYCNDNGYLKGVGGGNYDPAGTLTGYQAMAALLRTIGYDKNHEYEGIDWTVAVTKDAKAINDGIKADWANPISREIAAQLAFNTLNANPVMYVAILGDYITIPGGIDTLLRTSFGIVRQGIAFDEEGDPSYQYNKRNGAVAVDIPLEPVATYTTKVDVCDMLVDAGIAKTDIADYDFEFYRNGDYSYDDTFTHRGLLCEDEADLDGQGVLTRVYDMADYDYDSDFVVAQTYYYLAKVTKVTNDAHGTAGGIELDVYAYRDGVIPAVADGEGYKKGDYVIVHPLGEPDNDIGYVVIDKLAESFQGKRTDVVVDTAAKTVTYKIDGKEYNLDINYNLSATGPVVYKNTPFTWFFDLFGNLIGDIAVPGPATQYTVIDRIAYMAMGLEDGYAPAQLVNMKAEKSQINVTEIDGEPVYNGDYFTWFELASLSQQWDQNFVQTEYLYEIDGTELTPVEDYAEGVNITKGIATILLGDGEEIYGNKNTVYLYRTGVFGAYEYASYTGVTNAPTVVGADIEYVANDNGYIEVIFVKVPAQPDQITSGKFIVPANLVPSTVNWINDNNSAVNYYVYTIYDLDGNPVEIKALTNGIEGAPAGLYLLRFDGAGYYNDQATDYTPWEFLSGYKTVTVADADTYEGNVFVDKDDLGKNQYDLVNAKIIVIGANGITEITPDEAAAYLDGAKGAGNRLMVLESEYDTQAYSIAYIIPA